ncbi:unnamed protein product [Polarella glacialis]|uniref:Cyclin-dependent kinase 2 homolog n=1 Tax=Polarella glacialis TaxID=89957 RepID=A0A813DW45_POLGL|nr:unnamed protein product [Polarella glacialis]
MENPRRVQIAGCRSSVVPDAAIEDLATGGMADQDEDDAEIKGQYTFEAIIGSGSYGTVFKAINKTTGRRVAIKKMYGMQADEGVPATALREIALLKDLSHVNVIRLYEVFSGPRYMHLVVEFLDMDLRVYLKQHGPLQDAWLKSAEQQCFAGLAHCHGRLVLHRDLKPQNVLVDIRERRLVLADLGLARHFTVPLKVYTHEVATLWYRSIEILLGQQMYGPSMDVWSLGCIVAEMATGQVLFPSDSEIDTIFRIFRLLGTPTDKTWPGLAALEHYKVTFPKWPGTDFAEVLQRAGAGFGEDGVNLLRGCFRYKVGDRVAALAFQHPTHSLAHSVYSWGRSTEEGRSVDALELDHRDLCKHGELAYMGSHLDSQLTSGHILHCAHRNWICEKERSFDEIDKFKCSAGNDAFFGESIHAEIHQETALQQESAEAEEFVRLREEDAAYEIDCLRASVTRRDAEVHRAHVEVAYLNTLVAQKDRELENAESELVFLRATLAHAQASEGLGIDESHSDAVEEVPEERLHALSDCLIAACQVTRELQLLRSRRDLAEEELRRAEAEMEQLLPPLARAAASAAAKVDKVQLASQLETQDDSQLEDSSPLAEAEALGVAAAAGGRLMASLRRARHALQGDELGPASVVDTGAIEDCTLRRARHALQGDELGPASVVDTGAIEDCTLRTDSC